MSTRMRKVSCLNCGKGLDSASLLREEARPGPGDVTICLYCSHLMAFTEDLGFRELTDEERYELAGTQMLLEVTEFAHQFRENKRKDRL